MIEFIKIRNVKSPERNVTENAGIDFYIPSKDSFTYDELNNFGNVTFDDNTIVIPPNSDVLIPAGIMSKFPNDLALIANNKSGIATKKKLIFGASVIDASYQGEWHFHLINWSSEPQRIDFGQKIIQFIPTCISTYECVVQDMSPAEFFVEKSSRGAGGFGSTGV